MDQEAVKQKLENEQAQIENFLSHPVAVKILADNAEQQEMLLKMFIDNPIVDLRGLIDHFEQRGHLRGLRRAKALVEGSLEEIKDQLKEL